MKIIKRFLPRTLFGRSLLILVIPVFLIQVVTAVIFMDGHWEKITARLANAVAGEIAVISGQTIEDREALDSLRSLAKNNLSLDIHYHDNAVLSQFDEKAAVFSTVKKTLHEALSEKLRQPYMVTIDVPLKMLTIYIQKETGVLAVSVPQSRLFSSSGYVFLLWMTGISILLLAVAILFMRNQIRPIRRLAVATDRFGKGRPIPATFKPEGAHEVRQAAAAFIGMHDRIKKQIQQRTAMLAGVSHDLRTPLTRMKLQVSMLPESTDIEDLKQDIRDMERMIDSYLEFARTETEEEYEVIDPQEMLKRIIGKLDPAQNLIAFSVEDYKASSINVQPLALERAVENVIGNAVVYAEKVWVSLKKEKNNLLINVDDNGPGIENDMYEEVFKPFVRGEPSRNINTGGVGLGLSIARDAVHKHGGDITLGPSNKGGLQVTIKIPF